MPGLSDSQIAGLTTLFGVVSDKVVRGLQAALAEDAQGGGPIADVHALVAKEACDRRVRATVFLPVAPLCRSSGWSNVRFPPVTVAQLWIALKEAAPELVERAQAAMHAEDTDGPPDPVFDELCLTAGHGLRGEARIFEAANALLNSAAKDGGALFASYLDLCPITRASLRRMPEWLARMSDERSAAARLAYKDAVALADDAGPRYFEMLFASLDEPWQILRVVSGIMDHPGDRYVAASELARFGEYLLADVDRRLADFKAFDPSKGAAAGKAAGETLHVAAMVLAEFETAIELSKDGPWGMRVGEQKKLLADSAEARLEQIDKALDAALPMRMVRLGKGLRGLPKLVADPDPAARKRAEGLMAFFDASRGSASQSGYGSARAKAAERIDDRLDQYVDDLLDLLRGEEAGSLERIHAYLEVTADFVRFARDDKAAQIIRRRAAA
jgi:hypothetical protein